MKSRRSLFFLATALVASFVICRYWTPVPYAEQLVRIQAGEELGHIDRAILNEPLVIQALLLDYSGDKTLTLKAWLALSRYPDKTRNVLSTLGSEPAFKEVLKTHGDAVIPPIAYFMEHDIGSVRAIDSGGKAIEGVKKLAAGIRDKVTGNTEANSAAQAPPRVLGPRERGLYAVDFIRREGHDFLGQFVVDKDQAVKWNQTDRIVKSVSSFFTSGIHALETKHDLGEDITAGDAFWAGLDVVPFAVSVKMLRAGKVVAQSGRELSLTSRTRYFAPRLVARTEMFKKLGKYGAVAATAYIVISHPSLVNSLFSEIAGWLGVSPWMVQFAGWALIVALLLYPFSGLLYLSARFILFAIAWLGQPRGKPKRGMAQPSRA